MSINHPIEMKAFIAKRITYNYKNYYKKYIDFFKIIFMIILCSYSLATYAKDINIKKLVFTHKFYCGNSLTKVKTLCRYLTVDGSHRQCFQQNFIIENLTTSKVNRKFVYYKNYRTNYSRAAAFSCLIDKKNSYLKVSYTFEFQSCRECEWQDFYDANTGKYLGSTKSPHQGKMKGRKYITLKQFYIFNALPISHDLWIENTWIKDYENDNTSRPKESLR